MTLDELLRDLEAIDGRKTIYLRDPPPDWSALSEAYLLEEEVEGNELSAPPGLTYFLEVDIAREVVDQWVAWRERKPSHDEVVRAVICYATNDAPEPV